MGEDQIKFIRDLYGKYGQSLDPDKETKVLQNFERDFDQSLSLFYKKYNPEKQLDSAFISKARDFAGFGDKPVEAPEPSIDFTYDVPATLEEAVDNGVPSEDKPQGFINNMKAHLSNLDENVANSFWYTMSMVDRMASKPFDMILPQIVGENKYDYNSANAEMFFKKIQDNKDAIAPTVGILDEGATIPERASGVLGVSIDFARSIVSGATTFGAIPMIEQAESMYVTSVEEKAKRLGMNPIELMATNQDDELEPLLYGAVAGALERAGLKGVDKWIKSLPSTTRHEVTKGLFTSMKEGGTEYAQGFVEAVNTSRAQGKDINESLGDAWEFARSREGAETFVGGALGASVIGGASRAFKSTRQPSSPEESTEDRVRRESEESTQVKSEDQINKEVDGELAAKLAVASEQIVTEDDAIENEIASIAKQYAENLKTKRKAEEEEKAAKLAIKEQERVEKEAEATIKREEKEAETKAKNEAKEVERKAKEQEKVEVIAKKEEEKAKKEQEKAEKLKAKEEEKAKKEEAKVKKSEKPKKEAVKPETKKEEVVDLTETQEEITNEQEAETISTEEPGQSSQGDQTIEPTRETESGLRKPDIESRQEIDEKVFQVDDYVAKRTGKSAKGIIYTKDLADLTRKKSELESYRDTMDLTPAQKKSVETSLADLDRVLTEDATARQADLESKAKRQEVLDMGIKGGVAKTPMTKFITQNGTDGILDVSDGNITYTDESGEIYVFTPKTNKKVAKKDLDAKNIIEEVEKPKPVKRRSTAKKKPVVEKKKDDSIDRVGRVSKLSEKEDPIDYRDIDSIAKDISGLKKLDNDNEVTLASSVADVLRNLHEKTVTEDGGKYILDKKRESAIKTRLQSLKDSIESTDISSDKKSGLNSMIDRIVGRIEESESISSKPESIVNSKSNVASEGVSEKMDGFFKEVIKSFGLSGKFILIPKSAITPELLSKHFHEGSDMYRGLMDVSTDREANGLNQYDPALDVTAIVYDDKIGTTRSIGIIAHEIGHTIERDLYENATDIQKEAITAEYKAWLKKSGKLDTYGSLSKVVKTSLTTSAENVARRRMGYTQDILDDLYTSPADKAHFEYSTSFKEFFAESTSKWFTTNDKPVGLTERFFQGVAKAIQRLLSKIDNTFGKSTGIEEFLNERFNVAKTKDQKTVLKSRDAYKGMATEASVRIIEAERKISDAKARMKSPTSKEGYVKDKSIISKEETKIAKAKEDLSDIYEAYTQVGKQDKSKFEKDARFNAEKQLEKKIFRELDDDFDDTFANFARMSKIPGTSQRAGLLQNIATSINGRFNTDAQFKALIKVANENLVSLGVDKLTKKEVAEILSSTHQGETLKLKAKLYAEHKKRPRKELLEAVKLMGKSRAERTTASARIAQIEAMPSIDAETAIELDLLHLVGLDNASIQEIRNASDIVDAVVAGNRSRVALEVALAKNRTNVEVGSTFLESVLGRKPNADGSFTIVNRDGSKSNMTVFDIRKDYKAGDRVEHLGRIFKANHAVEMMTPFSTKNFQFEYAVNVEQTSATKAQRGMFNIWMDKLRDFSIKSHGLESLVAKMSEADRDASFMESKANTMIGENGFRRAQLELDNNFNNSVQKLNDIAKRVFGLKSFDAVNKKLADARYKVTKLKYNDNSGKEVTVDFTLSELMTYYAYFKQADLATRFERMKEQTVNPEDKRFWNDSKRMAILNAIPAEHKAFVDGVSGSLMKDIYEDLNKAYRKINGVDLVRVDNYFPVSSDIKGTANSEIDLEIRDVSSMIQSVSNHSLKTRRTSTSPLIPVDFISTTLRYANRAHHYAAYVQPMRKASKMLQQGEYRRYLENKFGKKTMEVVDHHLNNIAGNGAVNYQRNELVDMMRSGTIMGALSLNLTMIPKQLSSFAAYANSMPAAKWLGYYANIPLNPVGFIRDWKAILNTEFMKSRLQSGTASSPDVMNLMLGNVEKEVSKSDKNKLFSRILDKIIRGAYWPIKAGDAGAILFGGAPLWRHSYNEGLKRFGGDKAKASHFAETKLAQATSRTQQSSNMLDQSYWQTSSSLASMFTTFMSTPMLYGRILNGGVKDIIRGSSARVKKEGIKKVFIFGLLLPYLFQAASSASLGMYSDDEDDDEDNFKDNIFFKTGALLPVAFFQHIPILYPLLQNFVDTKILGKNYEPSVAAPLAIATKSWENTGKLVARMVEDGELDFTDEGVQREVGHALRSFGINYKTVNDLAKAWSDVEGSLEENPALLLGYSPYAIGANTDSGGSVTKVERDEIRPTTRSRETRKNDIRRRIETDRR